MENKFAWIMTPNKPWDDKKEMITTALESGISYVLDLDDYDKIQKLGNVKIVANSDDADIYLVGINGEGDGSLILSEDLNQSQDLQEAKKAKREGKTVCAYVEITDKNHEQLAVSLGSVADYIILISTDWTVIPLENIIADLQKADVKIIAAVADEDGAKLAIETLEHGTDGVIFEANDFNQIKKIAQLVVDASKIKYDLKELFKKHIALYIVTLLAAFGCWALHVLSEYVPDNGITPVAYPVMIAVYVIVCVVLFIVSIVFVILYFRRSMLKDEGYLTHTLPVPVWLIYVCKLISGYIIYLVNFVVIVVSVCIAIARVDWIWRVPESINEQLNVLGYKGSFCTLIIILIILSGIYMYAMFFFCMCMGYTANGNRDAFSFVTYIAVYIVGQILNVIVLLLTPIKGNGNMFEEMIKESVTGSDVAFTFEEFGHIMTGSVVVSVVMFIAFVVASIYILDKKLNLE